MVKSSGLYQITCPGRIPVTAIFFIYAVSDMPAIHNQVPGITDSQIDSPDRLQAPCKTNIEMVCRCVSPLFICRSLFSYNNIYFTVIDAGGAPIDGIILKDTNNQPGEEVTTGNKGPGKTEFTMWAADYRFKVIGNVSGRTFTSDTTHVLSVLHGHAVWDDLIRGGICSDPAACEAMGSIHYSYNVTFQRTW